MLEKQFSGVPTLSSRILLFLLVLTTYASDGQAKEKLTRKDTVNQWEIGLDLLWLIDKNHVPPTTLFARYNFVNKNNQERAWRFRLGVDNSAYDSAQLGSPRDNEIAVTSPYLRVGYEWQMEVSKTALYFYGIDASVMYSQSKVIRVLYPGPNLLQGTDKTWDFSVVLFIGIKYRPLEWLVVSTESSLNFNYRIRRQKDKVTDINFPNSPGGRSSIDVNEFKVQVLPITVINLSFCLNKK